MNKLSVTEKKEITKDWDELLGEYKLYKPLHFIKRSGPILTGIYLKPVSAGCGYTPQFHVHTLMTSFSTISLGSVLSFCNKKNVPDSISYKRHQNEFDKIALEFRNQFPEVFIEKISCTMIDGIYNKSISNSDEYPYIDMNDHLLLLYWCGHVHLVDKYIDRYKNIIRTWPDSVRRKLNEEDGWEFNIRAKMDMNKLKESCEIEVNKFNLSVFKDYELICE